MCKKVCYTCRVVFLLIRPSALHVQSCFLLIRPIVVAAVIVFFAVLNAVAVYHYTIVFFV